MSRSAGDGVILVGGDAILPSNEISMPRAYSTIGIVWNDHFDRLSILRRYDNSVVTNSTLLHSACNSPFLIAMVRLHIPSVGYYKIL